MIFNNMTHRRAYDDQARWLRERSPASKGELVSSTTSFLLLLLLLLFCKPMEKPRSITGTTFGYIRGATRNQERKDELPNAVDLSHHLSELAKNRQPSPLKSFYRYWRKPGVIGLAGGMEH